MAKSKAGKPVVLSEQPGEPSEQPEEKQSPRFKVGDPVQVNGQAGEITEVPELAEEYLAKHPQFYSVRLAPWTAITEKTAAGVEVTRYQNAETCEVRDHAADALGCVPEHDIERLF